MPADDDHFVRQLAPADLADDVEGVGVGKEARLHHQLQPDRGAAVHHPLQTRGVYGFVRHPVYFAWVLMVIGTPHMTMTRMTFAVISTTYLAIAIPFEERGLLDVFGSEYREYQKRVRWRMIPGVY